MATDYEQEVAWSVRAFPAAQQLLAAVGVPAEQLPDDVAVGWHGTSVEPLAGAIAVVRNGSDLERLIGDVLKLTYGERVAYVYVYGARSIEPELSISRRAFFPTLAALSHETVTCKVEVLG